VTCTEHTTHIGGLLNAAALFAHAAFEEEARASGVSASQAHRAVATLEERGLVERTPDARHARIYRYALTGDGRRTATRCQGAWLTIQETAMATFDDGERKAFTDLLERYIEALATID
jgi:DNA-binding MarR family transcriptional regulator